MTKYTKRITDLFYCPALPEGNFLNDTGGAIQALAQKDVIPYSLITDDLPLILPKRQDEGTSGVGEGLNDTVVLESQFAVGAGSLINQSINFLMIPRLGGAVSMTYTATEVFVITCIADASGSLNNTYFEFDIQLDDFSIKKYFVWFNVKGAGAVPTPAVPYGGTRTAVVVAIATDATANTVAAAVHTQINALTDVSSANTGAPSAIVTVTLDNAGGVDDAHDVDSGHTFSITTQGRTKIVTTFDAESYEQQNFGFQPQRDNGIYDIIYTLTGCSIVEHILECEHDGKMTEDINYMISGLKEQYGDLTAQLLDKMRDPFGVQWTKAISPYGNQTKVKNHGWHTINKNFTFTYNSTPLLGKWFGIKIGFEHLVSHNRDGGGDFASGIDFNKRNVTIGINFQPEDHYLFQMSRLFWLSYAGDLVLQFKSIQANESNFYVQFDLNKGRVLPFDEEVKADGSPEQQNIDIVPAPGSIFLYTIEGPLSNEYFGGHNA